jgi:large subunit ribosomal protein L24
MNSTTLFSTRLKKNDFVQIIAGRDKGRTGKIIEIDLKNNSGRVSGCQIVKKHVKPNAAHPGGGTISQESKIHLSNINIIDPSDSKPTRIGMKLIETKSGEKLKIRVSKRTGTALDPTK